MVFVPSIYRTAEGQKAMTEDDSALAAREAQLVAELEDVRQHRRLFAAYMVELGLKRAPLPAPEQPSQTPGGQPVPPGVIRAPKTWREYISAVLRAADRSLTNAEVIEAGRETDFYDRFKAGPNGYYNTVRNMELAGDLVKVGKRLYDPVLYSKIQSGEVVEDLPVESTRDSIPSIILRALREHGSGLTAGGIIEAMGRLPETAAIAERNPALIRTHLTKMKQAAKLISDNGTYKLPEWQRDVPPENITLFPGVPRG